MNTSYPSRAVRRCARIIAALALASAPFCSAHAATYLVTTTNDSGAGSLREAIELANVHISSSNDTITFAIPGAGPHTLAPANALPDIFDPVTIDGYTQPGSSANTLCDGNNAVLQVRLLGTDAGASVSGLKLQSFSGSVVRGLCIVDFNGSGIEMSAGTNHAVEGCFIGLDVDGMTALGNAAYGVHVANSNSWGNTIGGATAAARNVISANTYGIFLNLSSSNSIYGNFIGTDAGGMLDRGNIFIGILVNGSTALANRVGGPGCARNLVSGNGDSFNGDGIEVLSARGTVIQGNLIGTDITGTNALGNAESGILLDNSASESLVGGTGAGEGNVLAGGLRGLFLLGSHFNTVQGNFIGTDVTGTRPLPNSNDGIEINASKTNLIGGSVATARNLISGNGVGIDINSSLSLGNRVQGNFIGTDATGTNALANSGPGVSIAVFPSVNTIGGTNAGEGNVIAFNGGDGVSLSFSTTRNPVLGNSIHSNDGLGIDLNANGVTVNDPGDTDSGPNNLQNFPGLQFALSDTNNTWAIGSLDSGTNQAYYIEFFDNTALDFSGHGEGRRLAGSTNVITDAAGHADFLVFLNPPPVGNFVTTTATDTNGNTSEFSAGVPVVPFDSINLAVTKTDSVDPAPHATSFFYTITVTNLGPTNATGVVATDTLPAGLTFMNATPSQGSCTHTSGVVTCNLGGITFGGSASVTVEVSSSVTDFVFNNVLVAAVELDHDTNNNTAAEGTFLGVADLAVEIIDSPDPVVAGSVLTNLVTVTNLGPDTATFAALNFNLDPSVVPTGAAVSQGTVVQSGNTFNCSLGTIAAGGTATLTVTAIPTATGTITHSANVSAAESDPDFGNSFDDESTTVLDGPGIFQFVASVFTTSEDSGAANVTVERLGGAIGTVTVDFATSNLTALAGSDFTATNGTLTFTNGETVKDFTAAITDDLVLECNEEFLTSLFNPTGGALVLLRSNAAVRIFDNDFVPGSQLDGVSINATNQSVTANDGSFDSTLSDDGRYVAFSSGATDLVLLTDNNFSSDVFRYDRLTGSNSLVSVNLFGAGTGNDFSGYPQVSADGNFVVFYSVSGDLVADDINFNGDIFLRDMLSGTTALVSVDQTGAGPGNDFSFNPMLTSDGRFVVFESRATNLVSNDINGFTFDIFLRDMTSNVVELISMDTLGSANSDSYNPVVSDDGRFVGFESFASNLGPTDNNNSFDVYVRDRQNGTNILCSRNLADTDGGDSDSYNPVISDNGQVIVFVSQASDLAFNDTNGLVDVFAYDLTTQMLHLVSRNTNGVPGNNGSFTPSLSADGRYVAFRSDASDLAANDSNGNVGDIFVYDLVAGTTALVSVICDGTGSGNDYSIEPQISGDGRYVVFESYAWNLTAGDLSFNTRNIFRRDLLTGMTVLVSLNVLGTGGGNLDSFLPRISTNGSVVAFGSDAENLIPIEGNNATDVFVWEAGVPGPAVDLLVDKTSSTNLIIDGFNLTYTITLTNYGTTNATGVVVTDPLPAAMTFVSANASQGAVTNSGGTVTATVGSLGAGAGASIAITVTANTPGVTTNTAGATANEADATPANNTDSVVVTVTPLTPPVLSVARTNSTQVLVSWPSSTPNVFAMESTTNLAPVIIWAPVTNAISDNGTVKFILLNITPGEPRRFYRLKE